MYRGKHARAGEFKGVSARLLLMFLAVALILCSVIGTTVAWLTAQTAPVTNTFTYGDINITLDETDTGDDDNDPNTNTYNMLPGVTLTKDPKVTVLANSEDCWLFVKLEKSENFDTFMTYTIADNWTALDGVDGVYYRQVDQSANDTTFGVIKDNQVIVKDSVTKAMLNALDENGANNYPTLTVTAYAVQRDGELDAIDTAVEAWALIG